MVSKNNRKKIVRWPNKKEKTIGDFYQVFGRPIMSLKEFEMNSDGKNG